MLYGDYDYRLGKEQMEEMRREVEQNRLDARLAKGSRTDEHSSRRNVVARSTALVAEHRSRRSFV